MRRTILAVLVTLIAVVGLSGVAIATSSGSSVTKPRLERSLPVVFSNIYTQEAGLLGHPGVDPASLHATAMCDNGSGNVGPGSTWICLMSWQDPSTPMPSAGYGKFELNVHSNDCYTVSSPSSLVGFPTLTDVAGDTVTNPAAEFDGCFDPHGDDSPTGVSFPSSFSVTNTTLDLDASDRGNLELTCGTGTGGCVGTIALRAGATHLGAVPYELAENTATTLAIPEPVPAAITKVSLTVTMTQGVGSSSATLPVQGR